MGFNSGFKGLMDLYAIIRQTFANTDTEICTHYFHQINPRQHSVHSSRISMAHTEIRKTRQARSGLNGDISNETL